MGCKGRQAQAFVCSRPFVPLIGLNCKCSEAEDTEIIAKDELPALSVELKCWEFHEIVMGQLRNFMFMEDGIRDLVTRLQSELRAAPRKLIVIGEGSRIPEIHEFFEKGLNAKCETRNSPPLEANANMPATAYGMAWSIAKDVGAKIQIKNLFSNFNKLL